MKKLKLQEGKDWHFSSIEEKKNNLSAFDNRSLNVPMIDIDIDLSQKGFIFIGEHKKTTPIHPGHPQFDIGYQKVEFSSLPGAYCVLVGGRTLEDGHIDLSTCIVEEIKFNDAYKLYKDHITEEECRGLDLDLVFWSMMKTLDYDVDSLSVKTRRILSRDRTKWFI